MPYVPREGDVWLNSTRKELKFKLGDFYYSLHPTPWLVAGEAISAGNVVSIMDEEWNTAISGNPSNIGKVFKTDSQYAKTILGIALNSANQNEKIEVLGEGLYTFSSNVFSASDVGKICYAAVTPDGALTTDKSAAALGNNRVLEVGIVIAQNQIFINIRGDTSGDNKTTEYVTGEVIDSSSGKPILVWQHPIDGKVYVADRRKSIGRPGTVGFIVSASSGWGGNIPTGTNVLVVNSGVLGGFTGIQPGKPVLLDISGAITQDPAAINTYADYSCYVGWGYSSTEIIVSIDHIVEINHYADRIGTITVLPPSNVPDYGYLRCDGSYLNAETNTEYEDLYNVIGTTFGGTGKSYFRLPPDPGYSVGLQIKYKIWNQVTPNELIFKYETDWAVYNKNSLTSLDIPLSSFGNSVKLHELMIELYVRDSSGNVRLIKPGVLVHTYEDSGIVYKRYNYQVVQTSSNYITLQFAQDGLVYFNTTNNTFVSVDGWDYKVVVYRSDRFNRFFDYTADSKLQELWNLGFASLVYKYNQQATGKFDRSTSNPSDTTRLNYNGELFTNGLRTPQLGSFTVNNIISFANDMVNITRDSKISSGKKIYFEDDVNNATVEYIDNAPTFADGSYDGTAEVFSVNFGTLTGALVNGRCWYFDTPKDSYYVWYRYSSGGAGDPLRPGIGIPVIAESGDNANTIATNTRNAIMGAVSEVSVSVSANTITVTQNLKGDVPDPSNFSIPSGYGFTITVTTQGNSGNSALRGVGVRGAFAAHKIYNAVWNDYAECFEFDQHEKVLEPGRVYCMNDEGRLVLSRKRGDRRVIGVYSDTYGFVLGSKDMYSPSSKKGHSIPIGLKGKVKVWVRETLKPGDLLISGTEGFATKYTNLDRILLNKEGIIVGKVLEPSRDSTPKRIWMLIV